MLRPAIDWKQLQKPMIALGVALALGMMMTSGSAYFLTEQKRQHRVAANKLKQIKDQFTSMEREVEQINLYLPRFKELEAQGIIAKTAKWKERVMAVDPLLRESGVDYECALMDAKGPADMNPTNFTLGGFKLKGVGLKCNLKLLHEGEFFEFMAAFERVRQGLILFNECGFTLKGEIKPSSGGENLPTECQISMFTVNSNDESWGP